MSGAAVRWLLTPDLPLDTVATIPDRRAQGPHRGQRGPRWSMHLEFRYACRQSIRSLFRPL